MEIEDTWAAAPARVDVLEAALRGHPEGHLAGSQVTWPLRDDRRIVLERDEREGGVTVVAIHSPNGFEDDGYPADLAQRLREYVSTAVGDELDTHLHDTRR